MWGRFVLREKSKKAKNMTTSQFQLVIEPQSNNDFRLTIIQCLYQNADGQSQTKTERLEVLWGLPLHFAWQTIIDALKKNGYAPSNLNPKRKEPFDLSEDTGVRLSLLFWAIKPLEKTSRIEAIIDGISRMSNEEACYWFAKCTGDNPAQARQALRILLAGEQRNVR